MEWAAQDPEWAAERAAQLTAIAPDWYCPWSLDWQRPHRAPTASSPTWPTWPMPMANCPAITPGVLTAGNGIGL
ncbi:hypothetical protein [Streptomyces sp. NPDC047939]|uniref:hypothetical protein n=1 Tax=Streptomyces sp. NPDC047939 TaxID=3155381 RepID=UPI0034395A91